MYGTFHTKGLLTVLYKGSAIKDIASRKWQNMQNQKIKDINKFTEEPPTS